MRRTSLKDFIFMEVYVLLAAVVMSLWVFSGCSNKEASALNPAFSQVAESVVKQTGVSEMIKLDDDRLKKIYEIDPSEIENYCVYISESNAKADEIAVIKLKDKKDASRIKDLVQKRVDSQSKGFKDYIPEEYFKIQKSVLEVKNNYIFLVISNDTDKQEGAFDKFFK
jgi:lipopolysaccharide export LptBFGC system permease protein LptF